VDDGVGGEVVSVAQEADKDELGGELKMLVEITRGGREMRPT
jgi:hypothetical protein